MPNIFALGTGAFGQTLYTWDVYNVSSTTSYTVRKRLVLLLNGSYWLSREATLTDVFGFTDFYIGDGVVNATLTNASETVFPSSATIFDMLSAGTYFQPSYDYENDTGENIFTIRANGASEAFGSDIYSLIGMGAVQNVPVLASATEGSIVSATASTQTGWNATDHYYYDELTSTTSESKGTSTGNTVTSYNANAYPTDGIQGAYWYVRQ